MEPSDAPDLSRFRLVKLFTSCTDDDIKAQIISSFTSESPLKIDCATVAFGMGLDCTDVCQVIHVGVPGILHPRNRERRSWWQSIISYTTKF